MLNFRPQSTAVRSRYIDKADDSDVRHLIDQRDRQERRIRNAFLQYVKNAQSDHTLVQIKAPYERGDVNGIIRVVEKEIERFSEVIPKVFITVGNETNEELKVTLGVNVVRKVDVDPSIDLSFDPGNASAAAAMRQAQLDLIREIVKAQRDAIRKSMAAALARGAGFIEASNDFKNVLGLTEYQNQIVANYERALRTGSSNALDRVLRDRRFDPTVRRAINRQVALSEQQIKRMVDRYRQRMIAMRAETIARTEGISIVNSARHQAMSQLANKVDLPMSRIKRQWRAVRDGRTRDTHRAMNGQIRGAKQYFQSPRGAKLMFPGDRRAPASEVINCRCVLKITIKEPDEIVSNPNVLTTRRQTSIPNTALSTQTFVRNPDGGYHVPASQVRPAYSADKPISSYTAATADNAMDLSNSLYRTGTSAALTDAEIDVIKQYTVAAYIDINKMYKVLRGAPIPAEEAALVRSQIKELDSALAKASMPDDIVVYRGSYSRDRFDLEFENLTVGETVVVDKAYQSTTLAKQFALDSAGDDGVVFRILIPKGSKALAVAPISELAHEMEVLIARGATFVVRAIGRDMVTLELIP